jgi:hypothetical protein
VTADRLSSNAPHIETLHGHGLHSILGVKDGDHASLFAQVQAAEQAGRVTSYERHDRAARVVHRFRFVHDVPLHTSHRDVRVNFIEYGEVGEHKVQHFSWVTDLRVSQRNVYHLMRGGRARWKIENESNNVLKTKGYHLEHNFGHGKKHLASLLMTMNLLAFGLHTCLELADQSYRLIRATVGPRRTWRRCGAGVVRATVWWRT